jgi:hypothetical protein
MKKFSKINESIQRERIDFSDNRELKYLIHGESITHEGERYKVVDQKQTYFDGEKGYVTYDIIIMRVSDSKYFKGSGEDWGHSSDVNPKFVEVFRKEKITYYYE